MQCPSCQFENLPGSPACGRCGAQLTLSTAAIDVHPPRASARAKQLRRWLPAQRLSTSGREVMTRLFGVLRPQFEWPCSSQGVFLRMAVPGWPQRYLGHQHRARFIFGLYLALLLAGLASIGTTLAHSCSVSRWLFTCRASSTCYGLARANGGHAWKWPFCASRWLALLCTVR